jgi:hypothetical protein
MSRTTIVMAAALALAATLPGVSAQAQSIRTFVSASGLDTNPCSITQPCRHFSAAIAATSPGGEVDALDAGAYGSFTVSHAITIEGQGWSYVAPPNNGAAIAITAAASDVVSIHGVSINGVGASNATGIQLTSGKLILQNSVLRSLTTGLSLTSTHADVTNTDFIGNTTAISTNGVGVPYNSGIGLYLNSACPCATLVRINGGNYLGNTTVFLEQNPTAVSGTPSQVFWSTSTYFATGYTTLETSTGTGGSAGNPPSPQVQTPYPN